MLSSHAAFFKVSLPWRPEFGFVQATRPVSTNTAINRSLRKSKKPLLDRTNTRKPPNTTFNPDYGRSVNGPGRRQSLRYGKPAFHPHSRKRPQPESQYDYSRKAGGNRATRRAAKFGKLIESPSTDKVMDLTQLQPERPKAPKFGHRHRHEDIRAVHDAFAITADQTAQPRRKYRGPATEYSERPHESIVPRALPYTTSASEFLYGTSVIQAALRAARRKLYKLYMYDGDNREVRNQDSAIRRLASQRGLAVERVKGDWLRLLDKMSQGRPHNGYILEASPLPKLPVIALQRTEKPRQSFRVILDHQTREDETINGTNPVLPSHAGFPRYPFVLLLDGILDSGNLGAILRSAFFFGADAVAVSSHSASFSPVALKASAGAVESLPLLAVAKPSTFIDACKNNGWKTYAADVPNKPFGRQKSVTTSSLGNPLQDHPCILVLGSEGEGLRWKIQEKVDFNVSIEGQRMGQGGVDSLNVSVAAGLLCEAFLRMPGFLGNPPGTGKNRDLLF